MRQWLCLITLVLIIGVGCVPKLETAVSPTPPPPQAPIVSTRASKTPMVTPSTTAHPIAVIITASATATASVTPTSTYPPPVATSTLPTNTLLPTLTPTPEFPRPAACFPPADQQEMWRSCTESKLSPDGQWIATYVGTDFCGSDLGIYHIPTGQFIVYEDSVHIFDFMPDNRLLTWSGTCSNEIVSILDPTTGQRQALRDGSYPPLWNETQTAFITFVPPWEASNAVFWIYSLQTNSEPFYTANAARNATWAPDNMHVLYEHRVITNTGSAGTFTVGPRQIYLVDTATGTQQSLTNDPGHNYFMDLKCIGSTSLIYCNWLGDWLLVRRTPYELHEFSSEPGDDPLWICVELGYCTELWEAFWLNWRTGEMVSDEPPPAP